MTLEVNKPGNTMPLRGRLPAPASPVATPAAPPKAPTDALQTQAPAKKEEGNAVQRFFGGLLKGAGDMGTKALDWYTDTTTSLANSVAATVKDVPLLGSVAQGAAWLVSQQAQVGVGILKGAGTLVGGVATMIVHPVDTAKGLYALAEHIPMLPVNPLRVAHAAYDVTVEGKSARETFAKALNPFEMLKDDAEFGKALVKGIVEPYKESIDKGKYGEALGRGIFDIGSIVLTAGGGAAVSGGAKGVQVAGVATRGAEIAAVASRGAEIVGVATKAGELASGAGKVAEAANAAKVAEVASGAGKAAEAANAAKVAEAAKAAEAGTLSTKTGIWRIPGKVTQLEEGAAVAVRRSSGVIEQGWKIEGKLPNGNFRVRGPANVYKDLPHAELVRANPQFLKVEAGVEVAIKRSSGAIEQGWKVEGQLANGNFKVSKGTLSKEVPPQSLLEGNPALAEARPPLAPAAPKTLTAAERTAGEAQGFDFKATDRVKSGTPIKDGYVDGGGSMRRGAPGEIQSGRELVVVDRTRDVVLRQQLEWAKSLRNLPEGDRVQALMKYVDDFTSPGGTAANRGGSISAVTKWEAGLTGKEILLGDVAAAGGGVCRHRSLLFKVLGDEAGLSVDLVRGQLEFAGGAGRHAWNEVVINGQKVVVDIMNPIEQGASRYKLDLLKDQPYKYVTKDGNYGQVAGLHGQ